MLGARRAGCAALRMTALAVVGAAAVLGVRRAGCEGQRRRRQPDLPALKVGSDHIHN